MKRGMVWLIGLLGTGLIATSLLLIPGLLSEGRSSSTPLKDKTGWALTNISLKPKEPPRILEDDLGIRYLAPQERKLLRLENSTSSVKYRADLELERWALGCQRGLDCIVAITDPVYEPVKKADRWVREGQFVLSVRHRGIIRAYPLTLLAYHEIVNDRFDGEPVAVTFCPLCFSGIAFKRPLLNGEPLEFRVSGRLYNANLIMVDRQTGSFWSQITGRVIAGPLLGRVGPLKRIPVDLVFWSDWKRAHPQGQVLARPRQVQGLRGPRRIPPERYGRSPYEDYMLKPGVGFGIDAQSLNSRMAAKRLVFGIEVGEAAKAYPQDMIEEAGLVNDMVGESPVLVTVTPEGAVRAFYRSHAQGLLSFELQGTELRDRETGTRWSFAGEPLSGPLVGQGPLREVLVISSYWFAWLLFHPQTALFSSR